MALGGRSPRLGCISLMLLLSLAVAGAASHHLQRNHAPHSRYQYECEKSLCNDPIASKPTGYVMTICILGRLSPDRPPFMMALNPKCGSSTIRMPFQDSRFNGRIFEVPCSLYHPLEWHPQLKKAAVSLNISSWEEVAMMVIARDPMSRFVSGFQEMTGRMAGGSTHFRLNGFEWMLKEMELEQAASHVQKLQNLRSPEAFKHFMKSYVDLTKSHGSPFAWYGDSHISPQVLKLAACSPQHFRARQVVMFESFQQDTADFMIRYAGANAEDDGALLEFLRNPPNARPAGKLVPYLNTQALRRSDSFFAELWDDVKTSPNMVADYACTGYS